MAKRTKLIDRLLPTYSRGEEQMNMITHIVGGGLGVVALFLCVGRAARHGNGWGAWTAVIYGICMITLYTMSSVYHGLREGMAKKVMQVLDHCTIYCLIAGTYTPIVLTAIRPAYPALGWGLFLFEWGLTALAVTLTAIDLKRYNVFSMSCYIVMGWAIIPFANVIIELQGAGCFWFLLSGGISFTIGAILYGLGKKRKWMHSVFHIFTVLGTVLQFFAIYLYIM
ncbi:MAG: hemolysin III family protein [Oscillospiraceae bacterium]|nr:hemolysin III family protein [Oscillospiraceae bacterium]